MRCFVVFLGIPFQGSLKIPHQPFSEDGLPWQVPKPNPGVMIFNKCFGLWRNLIIALHPSDRLCLYFKCLR